MEIISKQLNCAKVLYFSWFLSLYMVFAQVGQAQVQTNDDGQSGSMKFSVPDLNDDETHSPWVPDQMKCDACQAVSYQIWSHFDVYNRKNKYKKYNLLESDIMDITDALCANTDVFNTYGIKEVDGINRLSGAGMDTSQVPGVTAGGGKWPTSYGIKEVDKVHRLAGAGVDGADKPGVIAGGGKWPGRLRDLCDQFMGRVGEEKIYAVYKKDPNDAKRLTNFLCRGPPKTVRGECTKVKEVVYDGDNMPIRGAKPYKAEDFQGSDDDDDDDDGDYDDEETAKDEL